MSGIWLYRNCTMGTDLGVYLWIFRNGGCEYTSHFLALVIPECTCAVFRCNHCVNSRKKTFCKDAWRDVRMGSSCQSRKPRGSILLSSNLCFHWTASLNSAGIWQFSVSTNRLILHGHIFIRCSLTQPIEYFYNFVKWRVDVTLLLWPSVRWQ